MSVIQNVGICHCRLSRDSPVQQARAMSLSTIPQDIQRYICQYWDTETLVAAMRTCRSLRHCVTTSPLLWTNIHRVCKCVNRKRCGSWLSAILRLSRGFQVTVHIEIADYFCFSMVGTALADTVERLLVLDVVFSIYGTDGQSHYAKSSFFARLCSLGSTIRTFSCRDNSPGLPIAVPGRLLRGCVSLRSIALDGSFRLPAIRPPPFTQPVTMLLGGSVSRELLHNVANSIPSLVSLSLRVHYLDVRDRLSFPGNLRQVSVDFTGWTLRSIDHDSAWQNVKALRLVDSPHGYSVRSSRWEYIEAVANQWDLLVLAISSDGCEARDSTNHSFACRLEPPCYTPLPECTQQHLHDLLIEAELWPERNCEMENLTDLTIAGCKSVPVVNDSSASISCGRLSVARIRRTTGFSIGNSDLDDFKRRHLVCPAGVIFSVE